MRHLSPLLIVGTIEPSLPFWEDRLGLDRVGETYDGDALSTVTLHRGGVSIMYQTRRSLLDYAPELGAVHLGAQIIYLTVSDIDAVASALAAEDVIVPLRETDYGARELYVREPGGHIIGFAQPAG